MVFSLVITGYFEHNQRQFRGDPSYIKTTHETVCHRRVPAFSVTCHSYAVKFKRYSLKTQVRCQAEITAQFFIEGSFGQICFSCGSDGCIYYCLRRWWLVPSDAATICNIQFDSRTLRKHQSHAFTEIKLIFSTYLLSTYLYPLIFIHFSYPLIFSK